MAATPPEVDVKIFDCDDLYIAGLWDRTKCCSDCHNQMLSDSGMGILIASSEGALYFNTIFGLAVFRTCHVASDNLEKKIPTTSLLDVPKFSLTQTKIVAELLNVELSPT